jgi:hypothetical protein
MQIESRKVFNTFFGGVVAYVASCLYFLKQFSQEVLHAQMGVASLGLCCVFGGMCYKQRSINRA